MQKNDNVANKALLIEGDANGFVRPHRDCAMVLDSLQFNNMSRLKTVCFSCELNRHLPNFVLSLRGHTKTRQELTLASARPFFVFHDSSITSEFLLITAKTAMFSDFKEGEISLQTAYYRSNQTRVNQGLVPAWLQPQRWRHARPTATLQDQFSGRNL